MPSTGSMLERVRNSVLEAIFPSDIYCICCGRPTARGTPYALCAACVRRLHWANGDVCEICGKPLETAWKNTMCEDCLKANRTFVRGFTCTRYGFSEREMIHKFKYKGRDYYGEKMAELMYERISGEEIDPDFLVPVPMHKKKRMERGYNQAELLAGALGALWKKPVMSNLLIRTELTQSMSRLGARERRNTSEGIYQVRKPVPPQIRGKEILLVDDVFTTGSTAETCASALQDAGAGRIFVLTFSAGADRQNYL